RLISRLTYLSLSLSSAALLTLCGCSTAPPDTPGDSSLSQSSQGSEDFETDGDNLLRRFATPTGSIQTFTVTGAIDPENPSFQSLGTNGRRCDSCHQASDGWTITPPHVRARFNATGGLDPLFRKNDGSNSPEIDDSTVEARRRGYSMLLSKAVIRVGIGIPDN